VTDDTLMAYCPTGEKYSDSVLLFVHASLTRSPLQGMCLMEATCSGCCCCCCCCC